MAKRNYSEQSYKVYWTNIAISLTIFTILTLLVLYLPNIREIDGNILHSVRLALSPYPTYIPNFTAVFGFANNMLWPQIAAGSVLISHAKYIKAFLLIFFINSTFYIFEYIKQCICRERPCVYPGFSFPSGHATATMCFYGILIYLVLAYVHNKFWRYFLITLFSVWIFMVGISRMWLGVHFLTDVLAGWALGFIFINLYIILDKFFRH